MSSKTVMLIGLFIGSTLGSYIPILWGASSLSFGSIFGSAVGGAAGLYIGYRVGSRYL